MNIGNVYGSVGVGYDYENRYQRNANHPDGEEGVNVSRDTGDITLDWSAGSIYASGTPDGQHFAIYKGENDSTGNPQYVIKGTDADGNTYEQTVDPGKVDPKNCSYVEFMAMNTYLVDTGALDSSDLNAFERPTENDQEKADYLGALRSWRDTQFDAGNMVGYHHAAKNVDAINNLVQEQNGTVKYIDTEAGKIRCYQMEGRLKSGVIGLTALQVGSDFLNVSARYADSSTAEDPVIEVQVSAEDGSGFKNYQVHINEIDPKNATELELFALCSYADQKGMSGVTDGQSSYMALLEYVSNYGGYGHAGSVEEFAEKKQDWEALVKAGQEEEAKQIGGSNNEKLSDMAEMLENLLAQFLKDVEEKLEDVTQGEESKDKTVENGTETIVQNENETASQEESAKKTKKGIATVRPLEDTIETEPEEVRGQSLTNHVNNKSKVPYSYLAKDGYIEYNGVTFFCDELCSALCLGDTSDPKNTLVIPMSNGGVLKVNRDNLGDLSKAIGMFSPEDVKRILEAMAQDAKAQQALQEIEEDKNSIGDGNTNTANGESVRTDQEAEEEAAVEEMTGRESTSVLSDKSTFEITEEMLEKLLEEQENRDQKTDEEEIEEQETKEQETHIA